ncbi:MAG: hypothetical protein AB7F88_12135 [Pyrinomonadaceae bacterium]
MFYFAQFCVLGLVAAVPVFSQARTVTNADLEKYRQQRLKAEAEYAENYEKMGFPSPEELQKRNERARAEREVLSARLAAERIQRERIAAELAQAARASRQENFYIIPDRRGGYFAWPYRGYPHRRFQKGGYFAWPSGLGNGQPIVDYFGRGSRQIQRVWRPRR